MRVLITAMLFVVFSNPVFARTIGSCELLETEAWGSFDAALENTAKASPFFDKAVEGDKASFQKYLEITELARKYRSDAADFAIMYMAFCKE